jgi:hypothetical protein
VGRGRVFVRPTLLSLEVLTVSINYESE